MGYFDENLEKNKEISETVEPGLEASTKLLEEMRLDLLALNDEVGDNPSIEDLWMANRFAITRLISAVIELERRYLHDSSPTES